MNATGVIAFALNQGVKEEMASRWRKKSLGSIGLADILLTTSVNGCRDSTTQRSSNAIAVRISELALSDENCIVRAL
jgi:hypothetical protein